MKNSGTEIFQIHKSFKKLNKKLIDYTEKFTTMLRKSTYRNVIIGLIVLIIIVLCIRTFYYSHVEGFTTLRNLIIKGKSSDYKNIWNNSIWLIQPARKYEINLNFYTIDESESRTVDKPLKKPLGSIVSISKDGPGKTSTVIQEGKYKYYGNKKDKDYKEVVKIGKDLFTSDGDSEVYYNMNELSTKTEDELKDIIKKSNILKNRLVEYKEQLKKSDRILNFINETGELDESILNELTTAILRRNDVTVVLAPKGEEEGGFIVHTKLAGSNGNRKMIRGKYRREDYSIYNENDIIEHNNLYDLKLSNIDTTANDYLDAKVCLLVNIPFGVSVQVGNGTFNVPYNVRNIYEDRMKDDINTYTENVIRQEKLADDVFQEYILGNNWYTNETSDTKKLHYEEIMHWLFADLPNSIKVKRGDRYNIYKHEEGATWEDKYVKSLSNNINIYNDLVYENTDSLYVYNILGSNLHKFLSNRILNIDTENEYLIYNRLSENPVFNDLLIKMKNNNTYLRDENLKKLTINYETIDNILIQNNYFDGLKSSDGEIKTYNMINMASGSDDKIIGSLLFYLKNVCIYYQPLISTGNESQSILREYSLFRGHQGRMIDSKGSYDKINTENVNKQWTGLIPTFDTHEIDLKDYIYFDQTEFDNYRDFFRSDLEVMKEYFSDLMPLIHDKNNPYNTISFNDMLLENADINKRTFKIDYRMYKYQVNLFFRDNSDKPRYGRPAGGWNKKRYGPQLNYPFHYSNQVGSVSDTNGYKININNFESELREDLKGIIQTSLLGVKERNKGFYNNQKFKIDKLNSQIDISNIKLNNLVNFVDKILKSRLDFPSLKILRPLPPSNYVTMGDIVQKQNNFYFNLTKENINKLMDVRNLTDTDIINIYKNRAGIEIPGDGVEFLSFNSLANITGLREEANELKMIELYKILSNPENQNNKKLKDYLNKYLFQHPGFSTNYSILLENMFKLEKVINVDSDPVAPNIIVYSYEKSVSILKDIGFLDDDEFDLNEGLEKIYGKDNVEFEESLVDVSNYVCLPEQCVKSVRNWSASDKIYEINYGGKLVQFYVNPYTNTFKTTLNGELPEGDVKKIVACIDKCSAVDDLIKSDKCARKMYYLKSTLDSKGPIIPNKSHDEENKYYLDKIRSRRQYIDKLKNESRNLQLDMDKFNIINREHNRAKLQNYIDTQSVNIDTIRNNLDTDSKKVNVNVHIPPEIKIKVVKKIIDVINNSTSLSQEEKEDLVTKVMKFNTMMDKNLITPQEYQARMAKILDSCPEYDLDGLVKKDLISSLCYGCNM